MLRELLEELRSQARQLRADDLWALVRDRTILPSPGCLDAISAPRVCRGGWRPYRALSWSGQWDEKDFGPWIMPYVCDAMLLSSILYALCACLKHYKWTHECDMFSWLSRSTDLSRSNRISKLKLKTDTSLCNLSAEAVYGEAVYGEIESTLPLANNFFDARPTIPKRL